MKKKKNGLQETWTTIVYLYIGIKDKSKGVFLSLTGENWQ